MICDNMRKNIAIYGSCISKDPFTTYFNENYKEKYNCIINDQKHSFISTMQEKEEFDESDLIISPDNSDNRFQSKCIKEDLEKTFITSMLNNEIDYLIIDINFEILHGVMYYGDGKLLTKITGIEKTKFYSKQKNIKNINIFDNPNQYFELWKKYCNKFFKFLNENCPNTKIILSEVRGLYTVQRQDLSTYIEPDFIRRSKINNFYYKKLEKYILDNFNVYVIKFDKDTLLKENHRWGKWYVHYDDEYYTNFLKKVDKIIEYDELKKQVKFLKYENDKLNKELIKLKQQKAQINPQY